MAYEEKAENGIIYYRLFPSDNWKVLCSQDQRLTIGTINYGKCYCMKWNNVDEKPQPLQEGVKCEQFLVLDRNNNPKLMYYIYEEQKWMGLGEYITDIKQWMRIPRDEE
jgi:hypothetical protein